MDFNLVQSDGATTNAPAERLGRQSGRDEHSIVADARFVDAARGDYRVRKDSPASGLGFVNFPMDRFGVRKPELRVLARMPQLPRAKSAAVAAVARDIAPVKWHGATVRNIRDEGEMSAFGLPGVVGVLVLEVPSDPAPAKAGLRKNDVILSVNGVKTVDAEALLKQAGGLLKIGISRDQKEMTVELP
jgi:hypothetical protein